MKKKGEECCERERGEGEKKTHGKEKFWQLSANKLLPGYTNFFFFFFFFSYE